MNSLRWYCSAMLCFVGVMSVRAEVMMPVSYSAVTALSASPPETTLAYGERALQTIERFTAPGDVRADIVLVHGGCWSADYSRDHARPLAGALADAGYRVWLPEYRRVGDAGGGWPNTWFDVRAAIERVASESAGAAPLIVVGHSAGGHLAMLAAVEAVAAVHAVVGLAPITDLLAYAQQEGSCQSMTPKLIGAGPDKAPARYREASVAGRVLARPVVMIRGSDDPIVPKAQVNAVPSAQLIEVPGAGHFDLIHPETPAFPLLLDVLESLAR